MVKKGLEAKKFVNTPIMLRKCNGKSDFNDIHVIALALFLRWVKPFALEGRKLRGPLKIFTGCDPSHGIPVNIRVLVIRNTARNTLIVAKSCKYSSLCSVAVKRRGMLKGKCCSLGSVRSRAIAKKKTFKAAIEKLKE